VRGPLQHSIGLAVRIRERHREPSRAIARSGSARPVRTEAVVGPRLGRIGKWECENGLGA
jgi:hypothetical protein